MKRIPVHPYGVVVYLTTDITEYMKFHRKCVGYKTDWDEAYCGLCTNLQRKILVGVFSEGLDTLVHELTHAVLFICHNLGIKAEAGSDEPVAYMMGKLVTDCLKACPEILYQRV